jgi:hypothetical protein
MANFIQSANVLVSRVASWVGAIPVTTTNTAESFNGTTQAVSLAVNSTGISVGDFIGTSLMGPFTLVTAISSTQVTVNDPDGFWAGATYPLSVIKLPTNVALEILSCIQLCELKMRTCELPALRTDPFNATSPCVITTDENGDAPIPADMNWPILFFQQTPNSEVSPGTSAANLGPWIMYDRVGDREIIRRKMIDQLYVKPFGVPRVIRASFSEVGPNYVFTPNPGAGVEISAYYIRTFPFLFSPTTSTSYPIVMSNAVLASFPEGYLYGTLWAYYSKNKNNEEAAKWESEFDDAYGLIEDQNFKDKWTGGDQHLSSEWMPRDYRYAFK